MITRARSCFASHNQTNKQSSKQNKRFRAARARILPPALAQLRVRFLLHPPRARSSGGAYLLLPRKVIDVYGHLSISRSLAWSSACFFLSCCLPSHRLRLCIPAVSPPSVCRPHGLPWPGLDPLVEGRSPRRRRCRERLLAAPRANAKLGLAFFLPQLPTGSLARTIVICIENLKRSKLKNLQYKNLQYQIRRRGVRKTWYALWLRNRQGSGGGDLGPS